MQLSHLDRCPLLSIAAPIGEERGERRGWQRLERVRERDVMLKYTHKE